MIYDQDDEGVCAPFLEVSLLKKMDFWYYFGGVRSVATMNRSL
jgi:hypothetical protein